MRVGKTIAMAAATGALVCAAAWWLRADVVVDVDDLRYRGLEPGISSKADVTSALGEPREIRQETPGSVNWVFDGVTVNWHDPAGPINTIIVTAPDRYATRHGVRVGHSREQLLAAHGEPAPLSSARALSYVSELKTFWLDDAGHIERIVLSDMMIDGPGGRTYRRGN